LAPLADLNPGAVRTALRKPNLAISPVRAGGPGGDDVSHMHRGRPQGV